MSKNIKFVPFPPFKRSGTTITQRTSGDTINSTGNMTFATGLYIASGGTNTNTLTINANDTAFITLTTAATDVCNMNNITMQGTWIANGTVTMPALTLGGAIAGGDQAFTGVGDMTFTAGSILASGGVNGNTLVLSANDTPFITFTTNATDTCVLADGVAATTQSPGDNSTKVATTAFVTAAIATTDTLSEVLAIGNTTGANDIVVSAGQSIVSAGSNGNTMLLKANDTTFITFTTGATDTCQIGDTTNRIVSGWFTDLTVTNSIAGSITGNAATVSTNANLTGVVTSTGNATSIAAGAITASMLQNTAADLGTADVSIVLSNTNSTYVTNLTIDGAFSGLTYNGLTVTANGTNTLNIAAGQTLTVTASSTLTTALTVNTGTLTLTAAAANNSVLTIGAGAVSVSGANTGDNTVATALTGTPSITVNTVTTTGDIELGNASDCTISRTGAGAITLEGVAIPTISSTSTLTNKRITKRVVTTANDASAEINVDVTDVYELSAIADDTTFTLAGTPTDGQTLMIRYKDDGAAETLTWTGFTAIGITLPATTTAGKWGYVGCVYNTAATAWHAIATTTEA